MRFPNQDQTKSCRAGVGIIDHVSQAGKRAVVSPAPLIKAMADRPAGRHLFIGDVGGRQGGLPVGHEPRVSRVSHIAQLSCMYTSSSSSSMAHRPAQGSKLCFARWGRPCKPPAMAKRPKGPPSAAKRNAGCAGAPGSKCSAGSSAPAKRAKRSLACRECGAQAKSDGSNWALTETSERGQVVAIGEDCLNCSDFAKTTSFETVEALHKYKKLHAKDAKGLDADKEEFLRIRAGDSEASMPKEGIDYFVCSGSRLEERYPFMSRQAFNEQEGLFPDEAKLEQVSVINRSGQAERGILLEPQKMPELVVWTEKMWMKKRCELDPSDTQYTNHAEKLFNAKVEAFQDNYGQALGGKYQAKTKHVRYYTNQEVDAAVSKACDAARPANAESGLDLNWRPSSTPNGVGRHPWRDERR